MSDKHEISQEMQDFVDAMARMNAALPSTDEAAEALARLGANMGYSYTEHLQAQGYPIMRSADGEILFIEDAPAVVYPDGRKLTNYGTYE